VVAQQTFGKIVHPVTVEPEDVVGEPDVVGAERVLQVTHFHGDFAGVAAPVVVSPDRLGAPVAVEWTTPRGRHVEAEVTVSLAPHHPVAFDVDKVPGWEAGQLCVRRLHPEAGRSRLP